MWLTLLKNSNIYAIKIFNLKLLINDFESVENNYQN